MNDRSKTLVPPISKPAAKSIGQRSNSVVQLENDYFNDMSFLKALDSSLV